LAAERLEVKVGATIALCFPAALCEGIDLQAAGVAAAGILQDFRPTNRALSFFLAASTIGLSIGALIGGRLADWIGRKSVLVMSLAVFGLFSLFTSLAWDLNSLIVARLLTGLGLGGAPFGGALASLLSTCAIVLVWLRPQPFESQL